MGFYLNSGNKGFERMRKSEYIDKTELIALVNRSIGTAQNLTCVSRARRFGKSYAAQMLCAYYGKECDSLALFSDLKIHEDPSFSTHLNRYDVIYLDMANLMGKTDASNLLSFLEQGVTEDIQKTYPEVPVGRSFDQTLMNLVEHTGDQIVMIMDEWDAPIRIAPWIQDAYLSFLRMLFKNSGATAKIFAAVYMTGILPIKKDGSQSAISDFEEYTMIKPRQYAPFVGFTESEVKALCQKHKISFDTMKQWYDGYHFQTVGSIYNPNSVMKAIRYRDFDSYWTETSAAEGLMKYISQDYNGLTRTIAELIGGVEVKVDTIGFANDLSTFRGRDDVLTLLIHLGYLAYNANRSTVRIPNEEIRREFRKSFQMEH